MTIAAVLLHHELQPIFLGVSMSSIRAIGLVAVLAVMPLFAHASLVDRGGGMVYDTDLKITWLQDWDYAYTSGYDEDGQMTWDESRDWANTLVFGGYDDWRLPTAASSESGCPDPMCTGSELAHVYNNDITSGRGTFRNIVPFTNLQASGLSYWTDTEYSGDSTRAWHFYSDWGYQENAGLKSYEFRAVAVRDGDVGAIPEPHTVALALIALGAGALVRKRTSIA